MKKHQKQANLYLYNAKAPAHPNGADEQYFARTALNLLTGIVSFGGFVCAMVFLVMLA